MFGRLVGVLGYIVDGSLSVYYNIYIWVIVYNNISIDLSILVYIFMSNGKTVDN